MVRLGENESARVEVGKDRVVRVVREAGQPSPFVRQMPRRVRIKMFNTGVNLKVDDAGPALATRGPHRRPQVQASAGGGDELRPSRWLPNQPDRSQWISAVGGTSMLPDGVAYTFRTTFDLTGMRPSTAVLHGRFVVDNHVRAIRLNGHKVSVPAHGTKSSVSSMRSPATAVLSKGSTCWRSRWKTGLPASDPLSKSSSPMGLLVELEGSAMAAWPEPSVNGVDRRETKGI